MAARALARDPVPAAAVAPADQRRPALPASRERRTARVLRLRERRRAERAGAPGDRAGAMREVEPRGRLFLPPRRAAVPLLDLASRLALVRLGGSLDAGQQPEVDVESEALVGVHGDEAAVVPAEGREVRVRGAGLAGEHPAERLERAVRVVHPAVLRGVLEHVLREGDVRRDAVEVRLRTRGLARARFDEVLQGRRLGHGARAGPRAVLRGLGELARGADDRGGGVRGARVRDVRAAAAAVELGVARGGERLRPLSGGSGRGRAASYAFRARLRPAAAPRDCANVSNAAF